MAQDLTDTKSENKRSIFAINKEMIPLKIASFLAGGVLGAHATFLNVFFVSVGLPKFMAGIMTGLTYAAPILSGPMWGYLSDWTGRRRLILGIICVGAAGPIFCTPWVAKFLYPQSQYNCSMYSHMVNSNSSNNADNGLFENAAQCELMKNDAIQLLFWVLLSIMIVSSIFLVPLQPYIDSIVATAVKTSKTKASFGAQRIFVCIGKVLVTYAAGKAASHYKVQDVSPYTAAFFILVPCAIFLIPIGCKILTQEKDENVEDEVHSDSEIEELHKEIEESKDEGNAAQILKLCCKPDVLVFLITVLIVGMAHAVVLNFSYLYVLEDMHKSKSEMTLVVIVSTTSEAIMFPLTSKLIVLLKGTKNSIIIGTFAQAVRFLAMSYDVSFGVFVALQATSALGFALALSAMMERTHKISPKHLRMTMSTIVTTLFFIAAAFVVSIAGAKVYEWVGGQGLFLATSMLCGAWGVIILVYYGVVAVRKREKRMRQRRFIKKNLKNGEAVPLSSA